MATQTTTKKTTKKATATKKKAAPKTTPLRERDLQTLTTEAGYAAAGVADEVVAYLRDLPAKADKFRTQLFDTVSPEALKGQVQDLRGELKADKVKETAETYRTKLTKELDERVNAFQKQFDTRVKAGKKVVKDVQKDERVKNVVDQVNNTTARVKGAVTSVRKTADAAVDAGVEAGKKQAENAKTQVKAAATSAKKTADTVVESAKDLAS